MRPRLASGVALTVACLVALGSQAAAALSAANSSAGKWRIEASPNRSGAAINYLESVACPTASTCFAFGAFSNKEYTSVGPLAERWNAKRWSNESIGLPSPSTDTQFFGVSCPSRKVCVAVGFYGGVYQGSTLVERWNGRRWSIQPTPNPAGGASVLYGVSCSSGSACTAVGYDRPPNGNLFLPLVESWNGKRWSIQSAPNPAGTDTQFVSVSCPSAKACTAVGFYSPPSSGDTQPTYPLIERWNGSHWSLESSPIPAGTKDRELQGVTCQSADACTVVGEYENGHVGHSLVERWNGKSWSVVSDPNPSQYDNDLAGISCPSTKSCTAVGIYEPTKSTTKTLVERWNGKHWSVQSSPSVAGVAISGLSSVSCGSSGSCAAVGSSGKSYTESRTLAEIYTPPTKPRRHG